MSSADRFTAQYVHELSRYFVDSNSSEMSYRSPFQQYIEQIFRKEQGYLIQHDPRAVAGNKPDFIVIHHQLPVLYIEVKRIGEKLDKIIQSTQASRYFGYTNLIITDYLTFHFFRNGQPYDEVISLGAPQMAARTITPQLEQAERLARTIVEFTHSQREPIRSGKHLAKIMGGKAQRIRDNVIAFLQEQNDRTAELFRLKAVIQEHLVAKLEIPDFADMYAQTLVYGLFAARYQDQSLESFTRQEARDLVPPSNPFLRHFFDHIAGASFPARLDIIVSELCEVFTHADVHALVTTYYTPQRGQVSDAKDPIIHFYEDFLSEYDTAKKMEMGVFYTPQPVVRFIVRAVDQLLREQFGLPRGLADDSTVTVKVTQPSPTGKMVKQDKTYHRVQVLDVATGTGTFLNEVILHIHRQFAGQEGRWPAYVGESLVPRLHGFELMMASYTIAHLKLGLTLKQSGVSSFPGRLGVYLTNTLDKAVDYAPQQSLFGVLDSIAQESREASRIKSEVPVMVVIGNPPYSGESMNPDYHDHDVYKVEPGGTQKLQERNSKWLNDDYVKFIRFAESLIEQNGSGIVGMITAHGYIDNPTFRGMRWHLRQTFDQLYVLDLHGNANKKEVAPDGSKDENVFDIKTGVSILIGVRQEGGQKRRTPGKIIKADLQGLRATKFAQLEQLDLSHQIWQTLPSDVEIWKKHAEGFESYQQGIAVNELFPVNSVGIVTARDHFVIADTAQELRSRLESFFTSANSDVAQVKFKLKENLRWKVSDALKHHFTQESIVPVSYRPFDQRCVYYHEDFIERSRKGVMSHFLAGENVGLVWSRNVLGPSDWSDIYVSKHIAEFGYLATRVGNSAPVAPPLPLPARWQ